MSTRDDRTAIAVIRGNGVHSVWPVPEAGDRGEIWARSKHNQILQAFGAFPNPHPPCQDAETLKDHYPLALLFLSAASVPLEAVGNLHLSENCLLTLISYF